LILNLTHGRPRFFVFTFRAAALCNDRRPA
jgi:hypothetical protein